MIEEYKDIFIAIIIALNSFWISIYQYLVLEQAITLLDCGLFKLALLGKLRSPPWVPPIWPKLFPPFWGNLV